MRIHSTLLFCLLMLASVCIKAQIAIDSTGLNWSRIENSTAVAPLVHTDADNGDGVGDGAMLMKGTANTPALQGIQYMLGGSPLSGESISLETYYYNLANSYVAFKMQVFDSTSRTVLSQTASTFVAATTGKGTLSLNYTFTAADAGHQVFVRFVRTDDLNPVRQVAFDYLKVNGVFMPMIQPPPPTVTGQLYLDGDNYNWSKIEAPASAPGIVTTDGDNGDGVNDGAIRMVGSANTPALQGIQYLLGGAPVTYEQLNLETKYFCTSSSYVGFRMQVYDATDNVVLAQTNAITITPGNVGTATLNHVFTAASAGHQIYIRFVRTDDLNPVRQMAFDVLKVNGQFVNMLPICRPYFNFDLPLTPATPGELADLQTILTSLSDQYLGTAPPTSGELNAAVDQYNLLNIQVNGTTISGAPVTVASQYDFLKTFALHLKYNPDDVSISDMAVKAVWYYSFLRCNKSNSALTFYSFRTFGRSAIYLARYMPNNVKNLFGNLLSQEVSAFNGMFGATFNGAINTDVIYLNLDVLVAYADWFSTNDEKIRYLKTAKRFIERFLAYTERTGDGIKRDGLGFHHNVAYDGYMYAYTTVSGALLALKATQFQVDLPTYLRFRDALYAQAMYSNDSLVIPQALTGRHPESRFSSLAGETIKKAAIAGGEILGLSAEDPALAGVYNRLFGSSGTIGDGSIAPFAEGYLQFNYGNMGIYRKNNWIAASKGMSNHIFGTEIYATENRFGRYLAYGAMDIIYPGDDITGNGYDDVGWDWNYIPGATTIVLPWEKLEAEKSRCDEYNTYGFAGALALERSNEQLPLQHISGKSGLFSMRFRQTATAGFSTVIHPNSHNPSFTFTKTTFAIGDYIICLGTGINNDNTENPTVTTLTQRLNNNSNNLLVNGAVKSDVSFEAFENNDANWILDNYNTGYYVAPNSGTLKIRNSLQTTPLQNQVAPSAATIAGNPSNNYRLAYLDHGTAPAGSGYEFVCLPGADAQKMTAFALLMANDSTRPYKVQRNDSAAQVIEYKPLKTWAYALPLANDSIEQGLIKANDKPCLAMYESTYGVYNKIRLAVSNPEMGTDPFAVQTVTLKLKYGWVLAGQAPPEAILVSSDAGETILQFNLSHGLPVEIALEAVNACAGLNTAPAAPALTGTNPFCENATGKITVTGSTLGLSFSLDSIAFTNTTGLFESLPAGDYTVYAQNEAGCISAPAGITLTVNDTVQPTITAPEAQSFCYAGPNYQVPALTATDDCGISNITYAVTGATQRSGSGADASGQFEQGESTITWTVTDIHGNSAVAETTVFVNASLGVTIPDVYAMNPATDIKNTIYLGYGPSTLTIVASPEGGTESYTYTWSGGQQTRSVTVAAAGDYTVNVTDPKGCQTSASIQIKVLDVRCGNNNNKVKVCHNNNSICVSSNAVQAHLNHGDLPGECGMGSRTINNTVGSNEQIVPVYPDEQVVSVYPNPVKEILYISVKTVEAEATVQVYNAIGVQVRTVQLTSTRQAVSLTGLAAGIYFVHVKNGAGFTRKKIVKL